MDLCVAQRAYCTVPVSSQPTKMALLSMPAICVPRSLWRLTISKLS